MPSLPVTFLSSQFWWLPSIVIPWTQVTSHQVCNLHPNILSLGSGTHVAESFPIMRPLTHHLYLSLDTQSLFLSSSLSCLDSMTHYNPQSSLFLLKKLSFLLLENFEIFQLNMFSNFCDHFFLDAWVLYRYIFQYQIQGGFLVIFLLMILSWMPYYQTTYSGFIPFKYIGYLLLHNVLLKNLSS